MSVPDPDPLQIIITGEAALNGQGQDIPVVDAVMMDLCDTSVGYP